jgi:TPP-dependent trihydroxycyclohexane-1,2-dione (THcHDO) dehydratase
MNDGTVRLTTAQAIIATWPISSSKSTARKCAFAAAASAFSAMATCTCLGEALMIIVRKLPLYRGQNEQSMGFAAAAYAKQWLRQRFMFCTASAGPGTANLLTSAALAHANRLPMLMLCGDVFLTRLPDPVLQQLEHFGNPAMGVNDAFKAVTATGTASRIRRRSSSRCPRRSPRCSIRPIAARRSSACRRMCRAGPMTIRWRLFEKPGTASAGGARRR